MARAHWLAIAIFVGEGFGFAAAPGAAQPYSREKLLQQGNDSYSSNCVVSAMNYYAILQQFPGWPNSKATQQIHARVDACKNGSVGFAGSDAKTDSSRGPPPPPPPILSVPEPRRAQACRAYAETAVIQAHAASQAACHQQGSRWSQDFDAHYGWCMSAGTPQTAREEANERSKVMQTCVLTW